MVSSYNGEIWYFFGTLFVKWGYIGLSLASSHTDEIWDSRAEIGLIWHHSRALVPIGTKSQIWDLISSTAFQGSLLLVISVYPYWKYSNFRRFYKKLGPFYKKIRCDKFGNWSISTKNALNNQIQSSMKIYMYLVWNCCLPIADLRQLVCM